MRAVLTNLTTSSLLKVLGSLAVSAAALLAAPTHAQSNYHRAYGDSARYVTIYQDCGFRGRSTRDVCGS